jgi:hypothetical protein
MRTIHAFHHSGADRTLRLTIPVEEAHRSYQVIVVLEPVQHGGNLSVANDQDWPPGFFEQTAGAWQGELTREPEGTLEKREEL